MSLHPVAKRRRTCPVMVEGPVGNMVPFGKDCEEHSTWAFRKEMINRVIQIYRDVKTYFSVSCGCGTLE